MRVEIACGRDLLEVEVAQENLVRTRCEPAALALADPVAAVREALGRPIDFPPLRLALTPDDHVAIVLDERLPEVGKLLMLLLEHICQAHVSPAAITILCPPFSVDQPWLDDLSDDYQETRLEVHDPANRKHLSYLATTRQGRRIYLNRTVVDADQVVLLTGRGYDPLLGYSGAECALYPVLSDEATRQDVCENLTMTPPGNLPGPVRREAAEVAWLLGVPFLVQVIQGSDAEILHVLAGPAETSAQGQRLLDARWRLLVDRPADVVVAGLGRDPAQQSLDDLARAFACASRVVKPKGRIILVSAALPKLGKVGDMLRRASQASALLEHLRQHKTPGSEAVFQWASAAQQATLYLLSKLPQEIAREMFVMPLSHAHQVQSLIPTDGTCLILPDAHKTMALVKS